MLTVDEHDTVVGFTYHDGSLDGVVVDDLEKTARFALRDVAGGRNVVTLRGVAALAIADFREGNIVTFLSWLPAERAAATEWARAELRRHLDCDDAELDRQLVRGRFVFLMESGYGATAAAICADADVRPGALAVSGPKAAGT